LQPTDGIKWGETTVKKTLWNDIEQSSRKNPILTALVGSFILVFFLTCSYLAFAVIKRQSLRRKVKWSSVAGESDENMQGAQLEDGNPAMALASAIVIHDGKLSHHRSKSVDIASSHRARREDASLNPFKRAEEFLSEEEMLEIKDGPLSIDTKFRNIRFHRGVTKLSPVNWGFHAREKSETLVVNKNPILRRASTTTKFSGERSRDSNWWPSPMKRVLNPRDTLVYSELEGKLSEPQSWTKEFGRDDDVDVKV
jgi:hypothetical protein